MTALTCAHAQEPAKEAAPRPTADLRMYVLDCGTMRGLDRERFLPGQGDAGEEIDLVDRCYLIQHPKGMLLWDAGLPPFLARFGASTLVWLLTLGGNDVSLSRTLEEQLDEIGVTPADIDYVAFSHLHTDHVGAANDFASSTWLVQETELAVAFDDDFEPFDASYYADLQESEQIVLRGDHDVFGDGRVVILSAPGHTPGHQCLFVDLAERGPVVLSGDLYHTQLNRELRVAPSFNTDREETVRSMERIEAYLEERSATLLIQHDPESNRDVPLSPQYLE